MAIAAGLGAIAVTRFGAGLPTLFALVALSTLADAGPRARRRALGPRLSRARTHERGHDADDARRPAVAREQGTDEGRSRT